MEWINVIWYAVVLAAGLLLGYGLGARRARRVKKRVLQQLNAQSLELLDTKSTLASMSQYVAQQKRKDQLVRLSLRKLKASQTNVKILSEQLKEQQRKHFIQLSHLKLKAVEYREAAVKATAIAKKAAIHLKRLEAASPVTQTIEAPEPKSYGCGEAVTVSVVDQARLDTPSDAVNPVSNRDSARLTKLGSSNEASATL